ncbi:indolethylamine N-methyltransferase-like [Hyla sarda]|uniref:indolethylamine N-methyltransferase-like n=1 Tax=Hyla sarda TaxID=327740 RepID=UPI0024C40CDC|nr:indolethylamine N-methyltransferase-like [Hyla sarda]
MDSGSHKIYHVHGYDSRQFLEHYFSDKPDMVFKEDSFIFPIENLEKTFAEGHISGDVLIDLSAGPVAHHLFSACKFFKHTIVLKNYLNLFALCSIDKAWSCQVLSFPELQPAQEESDQLQDKVGNVRSVVEHVMKCDLEKENMTDPIILPPADCVMSGWLLDEISKDKDDYRRYLKKISLLLKPRGHLILLGALDMTYFTVGKDKIRGFRYDEDFARKALVGEGFVIDNCVVKKRTVESDLTDYKGVLFVAAHKK